MPTKKKATVPEPPASVFRSDRVITIDGKYRVEEKQHAETLQNLQRDFKAKRIFTGDISSIEYTADNAPYAVLYLGECKVIIPASEIFDGKTMEIVKEENDQINRMLSSMLGAEIDFMIKGIDKKGLLVTASRQAAMEANRKRFHTTKLESGNPLLVEGSLAEARVITVGFRRLIVEVFGVDTLVPLEEISWQWIGDARDTFSVGSRIVVKLLKIETDKKDVTLIASVKQAGADPYKDASNRFRKGSSHVGEVIATNDFGVYVSLSNGIDCLCPYPDWRNSNYGPGSRVAVMIINVNEEQHRIRGRLLRVISSV